VDEVPGRPERRLGLEEAARADQPDRCVEDVDVGRETEPRGKEADSERSLAAHPRHRRQRRGECERQQPVPDEHSREFRGQRA